jgi:hypothetical protein
MSAQCSASIPRPQHYPYTRPIDLVDLIPHRLCGPAVSVVVGGRCPYECDATQLRERRIDATLACADYGGTLYQRFMEAWRKGLPR